MNCDKSSKLNKLSKVNIQRFQFLNSYVLIFSSVLVTSTNNSFLTIIRIKRLYLKNKKIKKMLIFLLLGIRIANEVTIVPVAQQTATPSPTSEIDMNSTWLGFVIALGVVLLGIIITIAYVAVLFCTTKDPKSNQPNSSEV